MSFNDQKHCGLLALTGETSGHIDDLEHALFVNQDGQINDMWHAYWDSEFIPKGHFNDRAYQWLLMIGYDQATLSERWYAFWTDACDGNIDPGLPEFDLIFPLGWTLQGRVDQVDTFANFARAVGPSTVEDFENVIHNCLDGEARFWKARRVENLYPGNSDVIDVLTFPVTEGKEYQVSVYSDETGTAIISLAGQGFNNSVLAQPEQRGGIGGGTIIAVSTGDVSLTIIVGNVSNILVEELNNSFDLIYSSEYVSVNNGLGAPWHGANVDGVQYFPTDRDGGNLQDMRGCLVEEGDPLYDPESGVQGTTQTESLHTIKPAFMLSTAVNDFLISLGTYPVRDGAADIGRHSVPLFIENAAGAVLHFGQTQPDEEYFFRKTILGVAVSVSLFNQTFDSKRYTHIGRLDSVDGTFYTVNDEIAEDPDVRDADTVGGDGIIHLGNAASGNNPNNSAISLVSIIDSAQVP